MVSFEQSGLEDKRRRCTALAAHIRLYIWEEGSGQVIRIMSGFKPGKKERGVGTRERVREIYSIYGPVFWQVRPKLVHRRATRRRTSPLPILSVRPKTIKLPRQPPRETSPPLSVLSKSAVVRGATEKQALNSTQMAEQPFLFSLVSTDVRSRTPDVTIRKARGKTPAYLPPRIQTKSAKRVSNRSLPDGSESKPSPWIDSFPIDSGLSPLLMGDYDRPP